MIETRAEYRYALSKGFDPLIDTRFPMENKLRREIQKEKFGKNNSLGNTKYYDYIIKKKPHLCENCRKPIFSPSAYNVSHILSRGSHQEMAHDPRNASLLCCHCHDLYEHSTTREKLTLTYQNFIKNRIKLLKEDYQNQE